MYQFKENVDEASHDAFVASHELCNLLQSSKWAKVKENWKSKIVSVYDQGEIIATAMVLIKPLPLGFTMLYIPRGPVMDFTNQVLVSFFFINLKKWAKNYHCLFIKMDPALCRNQYTLNDKTEAILESSTKAMQWMNEAGCIHQGFTTGFDDTIQPRFHAVVENTEYFETSLSKTLKKALQTVHKKKIKVLPYHEDGVKDFAHVMQLTEQRKHIHLRDEAYFHTLLQIFKEDAVIYLAKLPIKELLEESKEKLMQNEIDLKQCPENAKKKRFTLDEQHASLLREVHELEENYALAGEEVVVSGALCIKFGSTSELLYAGMDERFKRYMAPYASFQACMLWSFERDCSWCNMGGIEGELKGGLTSFKSNFQPIIHEFVGEFDLPVNRLFYKLSKIMYTIRKKK